MSENAEKRVVHGPENPLGLLRGAQRERAVHGADDEVQATKDRVGKVEIAVFEDIDLNAFQHGETA